MGTFLLSGYFLMKAETRECGVFRDNPTSCLFKAQPAVLRHWHTCSLSPWLRPSTPPAPSPHFRACPTRLLPPAWLPVSQRDPLTPLSSRPHPGFSRCGTQGDLSGYRRKRFQVRCLLPMSRLAKGQIVRPEIRLTAGLQQPEHDTAGKTSRCSAQGGETEARTRTPWHSCIAHREHPVLPGRLQAGPSGCLPSSPSRCSRAVLVLVSMQLVRFPSAAKQSFVILPHWQEETSEQENDWGGANKIKKGIIKTLNESETIRVDDNSVNSSHSSKAGPRGSQPRTRHIC